MNVFAWLQKWTSFWVFRLSLFLHPPRRLPTPIRTTDDIYATPRIAQFRRKFATLSDANVDDVFRGSYDEYWKHVQEKDNDLERRWRQRRLLEYTPRGLVLMFYDAYKRGFAYYADTYMPYAVLNVVAMKYVSTFQCRAFFIDEDYAHGAPIDDEVQQHHSNNQKLTTGPFLRTETTKKVPTQTDPPTTKRKNRFLNLGKIVNCQLLLPPTQIVALPTSYKFWRQGKPNQDFTASEVFADLKGARPKAIARFADLKGAQPKAIARFADPKGALDPS